MYCKYDITDAEFVPFLRNLGVETYKKSFEWMLNDRDFGEVLRWLFNNLDHNNALEPREEYRFKEIEKRGQVLSQEALESTVKTILEEHEGLCLPGDHDAIHDIKLNIAMQKEKLKILEKHDQTITDLLQQNELVNEQLNIDIINRNSAVQQSTEDEKCVAQECLSLAEEVDSLTENVIDVVFNSLKFYGNCYLDEEIAKKFMAFGPFDSYMQSQALFKSHFNLYTSKKFGKQLNDNITDNDVRVVAIEAKSLEERLTDALCAYIESKAELSGEQAKLALVANYNEVHHSQIQVLAMQAQSTVEMLQQEESILKQQIQNGITQLAESRTRLALETTAKAALAVREQLHADLSYLLDMTWQSWSLDRLLYSSLRHELRTLEELLQFAHELKLYVIGESKAVSSRIESMDEICRQQELCEERLNTSDVLLEALYAILGVEPAVDPLPLVKLYTDLQNNITDLKDDIEEGFKRKERALDELKQFTRPLREYIWDGCTKQPNCWDRTAASLLHSLGQEMDKMNKKVTEASSLFTNVKNGDRRHTRKLWQWFLADHGRLRTALGLSS